MPLRNADRDRFITMLAHVAAVYGRDMTPGVIELYWAALEPYDLAAVRQAFDRHVKNPDSGQFMPKPADLIRMLGGTTQDAALLAWAKVERAVRRVGGYSTVVFDDPLIHAVIDDMGGWVRLCETREEELPFRAREFENRYRGFASRRQIPAIRSTLIGRSEATNAALGFTEAADLVLIGEPKACEQVRRLGADSRALAITHVTAALPRLKQLPKEASQ